MFLTHLRSFFHVAHRRVSEPQRLLRYWLPDGPLPRLHPRHWAGWALDRNDGVADMLRGKWAVPLLARGLGRRGEEDDAAD